MDAPPIQYARTEDGVNIAYWTLGDGPVLVHEQIPPHSHLELEWQHPSLRTWYERLAQTFTVVRFDHRGRGLSDRDLSDLSLDAHVRDLDAVVHAIGPSRLSLLGIQYMGPTAIAYAANHHDIVDALILLDSSAGSGDDFVQASSAASIGLSAIGHHFWIDLNLRVFDPRNSHEPQLRALIEGAVTAEAPPAMNAAFPKHDIRAAMASVRSRTLVLRTAGNTAATVDQARTLVAGIPGATHVIVSGEGAPTVSGTHDDLYAAIAKFLNAGGEPTTSESSSAFRTILFTDIEESTLLTAQYGDAKARELLQEHERLTREALADHSGDEIKTMGDGFMVAFNSASAALDAAIDMQRAITSHFAESPTPMRIRIGINAGEPIAQDDDLYGTAVIQAARIMSHADGGEILVSDTVRNLVAGKDYLFSQKGEYDLKGFEEPARLFDVHWQEDA